MNRSKRDLRSVLYGLLLMLLSPMLLASEANDDDDDDWDDEPSKFEEREIPKPVALTKANKYLLYKPQGYAENKTKKWPTIFFMHGNGEKGDDLFLTRALPALINNGLEIPFIVIAPQIKYEDAHWSIDYIDAVLDDVIDKEQVDTSRIYVTGGSLGGFGSIYAAIAQPNRFAAIIPTASGDPNMTIHWKNNIPYEESIPLKNEWYCSIKDVPLKAYHGQKDTVVPVMAAKIVQYAYKYCGSDTELVVYPDKEHDAWTPAYSEMSLYDWMLKHQNKDYKDNTWLSDLSQLKAVAGVYINEDFGVLKVKIKEKVLSFSLEKLDTTMDFIAITPDFFMGQYGMAEFEKSDNQIRLAKLGVFKKK